MPALRNSSPRGSGVRRREAAATPHLAHLTPHAFVDPIRSVKRESIHWQRKVFHVLGIGAAGFTYALTPTTPLEACVILGVFAAAFVSLDALRFYLPALNKKVKRDFGAFMRDYELDGLSGSSWFLFAALITLAAYPKMAAALGMIYLALGDPLASFVGVKWGRIRLPGGKSLEGSLALFGVCALVGWGVLTQVVGLGLGAAAAVAVPSAAAAAVAEWLPVKRLDDNFVVPILTGGVATVLLALVA